jgi:hypothetical protein
VDPRDTDPEIRRRQLAAYRRMTPAQRVELAFEMSEEARAISLAGIRARNPHLDEAAARKELLRMLYPELVNR